jgi:benzoate membrane transport protein
MEHMNTTNETFVRQPPVYIASPPAPAAVPVRTTWQHTHDLFPAVLAGLIAVLISYAGPLLLVLQAGRSAGLTADQTASWVWAISIGAGGCGAWLSWRHRQPVICAWNTPGAALLVGGLAAVPYAQAVGAFLAAAGVMVLGD